LDDGVIEPGRYLIEHDHSRLIAKQICPGGLVGGSQTFGPEPPEFFGSVQLNSDFAP